MIINVLTLIVALFCVVGCSNTGDPGESAEVTQKAVVQSYATLVYETYSDVVVATAELQQAVLALTTSPSEQALLNARTAWLASREVFGLTDAFRFYGGPIDGIDGPEGMMNGWPMDESYVDYTSASDSSGIIANAAMYPEITPSLLASINKANGETNISCGYHAIEFLLWGQDLNENGPGSRPYTDFVASASGPGLYAVRRAHYINACCTLLMAQLTSVRNAWHPTSGAYRAQFVSTPRASLEALLTGVLKFALNELSGERMAVAMQTADQEDEHSCFSDNTHRDVVRGQQGIANVINARYVKLNGDVIRGRSFLDYVRTVQPAVADSIASSLTLCSAACERVMPPFDREITMPDGRARVKAAIDAIVAESGQLQNGVFALQLHVVL